VGHRVSAGLLLGLVLASQVADLEAARDAMRRHEYERAATLLGALAEAGNPDARYQLGLMLLPRSSDVGLAADPQRACALLVQAADAGLAKASFALAAQVDGGVCKDTGRSAEDWSARAAAAGHGGARGVTESAPSSVEDPATLLKRAAREGNLSKLKTLLDKVPAGTTGKDQRPALLEAADGDQAEAVQLLLEHGAAVDARDATGDTALLVAARRGAVGVIDRLLAGKADPNVVDARGGTPLLLAAATGSERAVTLLLDHGADASARNAQGLSALDLVERSGKKETAGLASLLKSRGATGVARVENRQEIRADDRYAGWSAFLIACDRGEIGPVKSALASGADPNGVEPIAGVPALVLAARAGHLPVIDALLAAGARIEARTTDGDTALGAAVRRRQVAAVGALLAHHADPNARQARGALPLVLAAEAGGGDLLAALLAGGAKPSTTDGDGRSALMAAAQHDDIATVAALLKARADVRQRDSGGKTALALAIAAGAKQTTAQLIAAGGLDVADADGVTPLGLVAQRGDLAALDEMLKTRPALETRSRTGTPLLLAAGAGQVEAIRRLLAAGAKLEARNDLGNTPFLAAVTAHQVDAVRVLLAAGADRRIRNGAAQSAADIAKQGGDARMLALLAAGK
jgi:uncharacterized protein